MQANHLVSADWLSQHLHDPDVVVVDCRFTLGKPGAGLAEYTMSHIPGALYFDLEQDLSGPIREDGHGGRHPLPDPAQLAALFSSAGIDEQTKVVAYDEQDMAMAARLWWLLRYLGHERAAVLDGGFKAWRASGLPVSQEIPTRSAKTFIPRPQPRMLVSADEVKGRSAKTALVDSRAKERYRGEMETIDRKAGHIPGALHYFYQENLRADGTFLPPDELARRFDPLKGYDDIIVYCGSGVTACVNVLALYLAGRPETRLYLGSWSDWISYEENPIATGDE